MTKEYIIWGKSPKNPEHSEPLHTQSKSRTEAEKIMVILAAKYDCHAMRIQVLDLTEPLNWQGLMRKAIKKA